MSAEIAKKRGRPKKVITEPVEVDIPGGTKKTTTRAKSTKAAPKTKTTKSPPKATPPPTNPQIPKHTPGQSKILRSLQQQQQSSNPPNTSFPSPPSPSKPPPPPPSSTITGINQQIVNNISSRAGARPLPPPHKPLPANYRSVANRLTMAIVAMPIALVTSWVLYERFVLGQERKLLVKRPGEGGEGKEGE